MLLLGLGAILLFLWAKFNLPTSGTHVRQGFVFTAFNIMWLFVSVAMVFVGWITMVMR